MHSKRLLRFRQAPAGILYGSLLLTAAVGWAAGAADKESPVEAIEKNAAVDAPVSAVVVYSDRARVVRSTRIELEAGGPQKLTLPLLQAGIDPSSIRIDARGARPNAEVEVERVEIAYVSGSELPFSQSEARKLLFSLEQLDGELGLLENEAAAYSNELALLSRLTPVAPPLPTAPGNANNKALLNAAGWGGAFAFLRSSEEKLHARLTENAERSRTLSQQRQQLVEQVRLYGGGGPRAGYRVTPTLRGHGPVELWLSYMTDGARWSPLYDIQLLPGKSQVELSFAGQVSQETGEDWNNVMLVLSTAVPSTATQAPRLSSWKLGSRERFIPTPPPVGERLPPLPPPLSPTQPPASDELRRRLLSRAGLAEPPVDAPMDELRAAMDKSGTKGQADRDAKEVPPPPPPPPPPAPPPIPEPMLAAPPPKKPFWGFRTSHKAATHEPVAAGVANEESSVAAKTTASGFSFQEVSVGGAPAQVVGIGLAPPPGYRPPPLDKNSPAALAGGYDLSYSSLYKESVGSGKGARRVALFSRTFPVAVQRKVFAALAKEAYLVAELKNPSTEPLPGGQAHLFVGADPAGEAMVNLVAPGESFTLPLGLDRAIKPIRNVRMSTLEKGLISKDEITEYVVTTELVNPYPVSIDVQLLDQIPVAGDKNVEIKLIRTEPPAATDRNTAALMWRRTVPPGAKIETRFVYTLRRPKGARLFQ